jgi:hypothetical protein
VTEQTDKIITAEHRLDDARNLVEAVFILSKDIGGLADPIKTASNLAGEKIIEAIALLEQARNVAR